MAAAGPLLAVAQAEAQAMALLFAEVDLGDQPEVFELSWPAVSGATGVAVESASLTLLPGSASSAGRSLGILMDSFDGTTADVTIPGGPLSVRSFHLARLRVRHEGRWRTVRNEGDLPSGWRIAVSVPQGSGFSAPGWAAPPVRLSPGIIPDVLAGASLTERVLRLPDVEAPRFRLQVLSGDFPSGLVQERFRVRSISARAAPEPVDVEAVDAAGVPVWRQDGRVAEPVTLDLKAALERTLEQAIASGEGPRTGISISAGRPGTLLTGGLAVKGRILRRIPGKLAVECEGDVRPLEVSDPPLDPRLPERAVADVVVRHRGLRLHPLSDPVPERTGDLQGPVLSGDVAVVRVLPPRAMEGEELRRIGLVAVVREPTEVSVRVLEVVGDTATGPLGAASATVAVEPLPGFAAARPRVVWLDLPDPLVVDRALAVEAAAPAGRVHWVAGDDGEPALRFAVTEHEAAGERLRLAGQDIVLTGERTELLGRELPAGAFRGAPPEASTDQFCEVVVSNLVLEYRA